MVVVVLGVLFVSLLLRFLCGSCSSNTQQRNSQQEQQQRHDRNHRPYVLHLGLFVIHVLCAVHTPTPTPLDGY